MEHLTGRLNRVKALAEHRLYREEQFSIDRDVLTVRNCLNWVFRINKLISHFKFSYANALSYAVQVKMPTEHTEEKDMYSFHLENCLFRLLALWDIYGQLLNEFYNLGYTKKDCSIWNSLKSMKNKGKDLRLLSKKVYKYMNKGAHQYVRKELRNSFVHSADPHEMQIFHYPNTENLVNMGDFSMPDHPYKELLLISYDFRKIGSFLHQLNHNIGELLSSKCMLIMPTFLTVCGKRFSDGRPVLVTILDDIHDLREASLDGKECRACKETTGNDQLKYCKVKSFIYHRIHEPDELVEIAIKS